ncbi:MAG TPA: hypothetical protein VK892_12410, partial [Pyrinomonadaceae bacterium]|nr:hypothetical protein [Pyrinomonadaceae bacterium]
MEKVFQNIPLYFEPNVGQADEKSSFLTRGNGYEMSFFADKAVLSLAKKKSSGEKEINSDPDLSFSTLTMSLADSNKNPQISGEEETAGKVNYLVGNDRDKWLTDIPTYQKVRYKNVYSGIDLLYYGKQTELEFDFIVSPGADPEQIKLDFSGAEKIAKNSDGELVISVGEGEVVLQKPVLYQTDNQGQRQNVEGEFALVNENSAKFKIGEYDRARQLVIDPILSYSTYLPGARAGYDIAVDNDENAIVTG